MGLSRDQLKAAFRSEDIAIDALGGETVTFHDFNAAERLSVLSDFQQAANADDQMADQQRLMCRMVQLVLVDESGERMYGPDELETISHDLRGDVLEELSNKAMIFAGFASDDDDAEVDTDQKKDLASKSDSSTG